MRSYKIIAVVLGVLLMSGCGDQMYCGDDGCNHSSHMSAPIDPMKVLNGSILENML